MGAVSVKPRKRDRMETKTITRREIVIKVIAIVLLAALLILSVTVFSKAASDPDRYERTLTALDEKEATVLKMTGASAAVATAIAAVPGDATTPVADELADLASYFVIVLTVIIVEKYLVAVIGHVAFTYLIPAACLLAMAGVLLEMGTVKRWAVKLGVFGLILCLVIPLSMGASNIIEKKADATYEATIDEAREITEEITENTDSEGNFITKAWDRITGGVSNLTERGEKLFVDFLESIAVMLATSCVIPIVVLLAAFWAIKALFGLRIDFSADRLKKRFGRSRKDAPTDE